MQNVKQLIQKYLQSARVMQLATSINNNPWVCNLHFYADEELHLYWISTTARRHSQEIEQNQHIATSILIHEDTPDEAYVIGISAEGKAEVLSDEEIEQIGHHYVSKLNKPANLLEDIRTGKNPHKFYRLKPERIVLFDNKEFPDNPRQEYHVK